MNDENVEENEQEFDVPEGGIRIGDIYIPPPPMPSCTFDTTGPRLVITKIENYNFKSYAGRTDLGPFHKNFTSIVGPNGSGKSNVIDAMLFVFGYRAQRIRLKKVGGLVHLSDQYPNLNSCTVKVHFAKIKDINDSEFELIPGTEFNIGRTAFKDNSSYYEINGKRTQFKNVSTCLRSQGIDLDHNRFLILQGEIEMIAMMKPKGGEHDTGMLEYLEDIIGCNRFIDPIAKFAQKVEDLNEIRMEKLNRVKVVEKEKDEVEAAKNEAIEYMKLENQITLLENKVYQRNLRNREAEVQNAVEDRDQSQVELERLLLDQAEAKEAKKVKEESAAEIMDKYDQSAGRLEAVKQKFNDLEKDDIVAREDHKVIKNKLEKRKEDLNKENKTLCTLKSQPEQLEADAEELEKKEATLLTKKEAEQKKLKEVIESTKGETEGLQEEKNKLETTLMELKKTVNEKNANMNLAQSELDIYVTKERKEKARLQELQDKLLQTTQTLEGIEKSLKETKDTIPSIENKLQAKRTQRDEIARNEANLYEEMKENRTKAEEMRSAFNSFRNRGVVTQFLMEQQNLGNITGIFGRLGDLGGIDKMYDVAISTACPALDNLLTDTVDTAQECIRYLKRYSKGYTTIIALDKMNRWIPHAKQQKNFSKTGYPENVPRLFDLVAVKDERVLPALYFVLRDTLVANDIEQATRIGLNSGKRYRVVTLKGEVVDLSGTMSGGGTRKISGRMGKSATVSDINPRDLENLEKKIEEQNKTVADFREKKVQLEMEIETLQRSLTSQNHSVAKNNSEFKALVSLKEQLTNQVEVQRPKVKAALCDPKKVKELESTLADNKKAYETASKAAEEVESKVKKLQAEITAISKGKYGVVQKSLDKLVKEIGTIRTNINKCRTAAKAAQRNQTKSANKIESLNKEIKELEAKNESCKVKLSELTAKGASLLKERDLAKEQLDGLEEQKKQVQKELDSIHERELKLKCAHIEQVNTVKAKDAVVKEKQDAVKRVKIHLSKLKLQRIEEENQEEEEEVPTTLPTLTPEELDSVSENAVNYEIENLRGQMSKMKPNMSAIAEFKRKVEMYKKRVQEFDEANRERDEMKKHHDDLRRQRLDEFLTGFRIITSKLKEVYQMITLGGDAELELVDSLDPFTEGIIFSVRPPKKSWKNITNLSGGEKTLSSLALVFALHYYKPTPFYVMDEIDAALDFKNVSIVGNYIKERTKNAQFIIISLRNNMFELADRLVGIFKTYNCTKSCTIAPLSMKEELIILNDATVDQLRHFLNEQKANDELAENEDITSLS